MSKLKKLSRRDEPALARCDVVLLVPVVVSSEPKAPFEGGPLPLRWRIGRRDEVAAKAESRRSYTSDGLLPLLWADTVRWHREASDLTMPKTGFALSGVEIVRLTPEALHVAGAVGDRGANGVALLHGTLPVQEGEKVPRALHRTCNIDPSHGVGQREWIGQQLPEGSAVSSSTREALACTLVTAVNRLPELFPRQEYAEWRLEDRWFWSLYYSARYLPDTENLDDLRALQIRLSSKVRGIVTHRGLSLVGTAQDPGRGTPVNFYDGTTYHLRTLYADAVALACLQRIFLDAIGGAVAKTGRHEPKREEVARLERELLSFRRTYWSAHFGHRESMDVILAACQRQFGLQAEMDRLVRDLGEFSRQVQAVASETTNAILGLLTAGGLPITVGVAMWQGLADNDYPSLWKTVALSVAVSVGLVVVFPGLKRLLSGIFSLRRR
jgi:hypothetical protein